MKLNETLACIAYCGLLMILFCILSLTRHTFKARIVSSSLLFVCPFLHSNNGRQFTSMNRCPKKMCTGVPRDARRTIMFAIGCTPSCDGCARDRNVIYASFLTVCGSKRACTPTVPLGSWVINACTIAMRMLRNSYRTRDAY